MAKKHNKVFVGMSGGVDSSVAALILKRQGYEVVGIFIYSYNIDGCSDKDVADARKAAETIGIPFYVWDFESEYRKEVVGYMIDGYKRGITPNPDVLCNSKIKFGVFMEKAIEAGADYISTGHYARLITDNNGIAHLFTAKDKNKDQSYFLWKLKQEQLSKCIFPIGDYLKSDVRKIAKEYGLHNADKKDSQGICFLGKVNIYDFLKKYIKERRGKVVLVDNKNSQNGLGPKLIQVGEHNGVEFYTIGQRHFRVNITPPSGSGYSGPYYIYKKDAKTNTLFVVEGRDNPALYRKEMRVSDINFTYMSGISNLDIYARVRYRQSLSPAVLMSENNADRKKDEKCGYLVKFKTPQKFIAEGQSAVFYARSDLDKSKDSYEVVGGGVIC